jgi:hypothetical protein
MADATDLKSVGPKGPCGFESRHRHQVPERLAGRSMYRQIDDNSKNYRTLARRFGGCHPLLMTLGGDQTRCSRRWQTRWPILVVAPTPIWRHFRSLKMFDTKRHLRGHGLSRRAVRHHHQEVLTPTKVERTDRKRSTTVKDNAELYALARDNRRHE